MKSLQNLPRAAFTLIELLVVITIIAVLASMAVPAANVVIRKARETQARAIMTGLIMGIKAYQTEYNRFPDPSATPGGGGKTSDEVIAIDGQDGLMAVLHPDQSQPVAPNSPNPRRINFYDPPPAKGTNPATNGYVVADGSLVDPWNSAQTKHPIRVAMDYGGDGAIDQALDPFGDAQANIQTQVIAWSTGYPVHPPAENDAQNAAEKNYFLCTWR